MATLDAGRPRIVQIRGENRTLVDQLREAVAGALEGRRTVYVVEIAAVGRDGEVLISIHGSRGRLPLLFHKDELAPAHVHELVKETVGRLGL
jgi:hypothetical protein